MAEQVKLREVLLPLLHCRSLGLKEITVIPNDYDEPKDGVIIDFNYLTYDFQKAKWKKKGEFDIEIYLDCEIECIFYYGSWIRIHLK